MPRIRRFHRTSRSVELTDAGRRFLEGVRATLEQARRAQEGATRAGAGEVGSLRIGFVPACAVMPPIVRSYARQYPEVQLTLCCLPSAAQLSKVGDGQLDAGFVHLPIHVPGLATDLVQAADMMVALTSGHPLAGAEAVAWASLAEEKFIGFPRASAPGAYDMLISHLRAAGLFPRIVHETDSLLARLRLVAAGIGISLVPSYATKLECSDVVIRPLRPPGLGATIGVVHDPERLPAPLVHFLTAVREFVSRKGEDAGD